MQIDAYIQRNKELLLTALRELCRIPAPSHYEDARAQYCRAWLETAGAEGVYIDEAKNVIFPLNCQDSRDITVFAAHTDTVFPDMEPMPMKEDENRIYCPGAADDTASVAVLLLMAKFFVEQKISPSKGILFVCNSCEEGLGNLKGTRALFAAYAGRIGRFVTFDSSLHTVNDHCVGSHRYEVTVHTRGGHSFEEFGGENAIAELSKIVNAIYKLQVPQKEGAVTTYNVGTIRGGTSVNTIAQRADMLFEFRSDEREALAVMQKYFDAMIENSRKNGNKLNVTVVGDRPCGAPVDEKLARELGADIYTKSAFEAANLILDELKREDG